jgi:hypothetical protein
MVRFSNYFRSVPAACAIVALGYGAVFAQAIGAGSQPSTAGNIGSRHRVEASMMLDSSAPAVKGNREHPQADLKMRVRISDHAIDSDFYGVVTLDHVSSGSEQHGAVRTIWHDAVCHRDRGLPKVSIVDITGTITGMDMKSEVAAIPRRIGKHIPEDEIVAQPIPASFQGAKTEGDESGIFVRAHTKRSGIRVILNVVATRCALKE